MPRLEGTSTNPFPILILLIGLLVLAFLALELTGTIDLIAGFGDDQE